MTNVASPIIEVVLKRLGIKFRNFPCKNGEFYFCEIPSTGLSFDLQLSENGYIKLWRFIGTASPSKADKTIKYTRREYPCCTIGLEVTSDCDICLYAEQLIDSDDFQSEKRITKMLKGYINLIGYFPSQNLIC